MLDRLAELVVKPVDGSGGKGIVIGPRASPAELAALRRRVLDDPRGWIAQPVVQLSTVPTLIDDLLRPRHVDLRPFAVNDGDDVWVLPGGLTRVALPEGELVVNSSQGGGSKDTWVLSPPTHRPPVEEPVDSDGFVGVEPPPTPVRPSVPLTVARIPPSMMPKRAEKQRQQDEQQQQCSGLAARPARRGSSSEAADGSPC